MHITVFHENITGTRASVHSRAPSYRSRDKTLRIRLFPDGFKFKDVSGRMRFTSRLLSVCLGCGVRPELEDDRRVWCRHQVDLSRSMTAARRSKGLAGSSAVVRSRGFDQKFAPNLRGTYRYHSPGEVCPQPRSDPRPIAPGAGQAQKSRPAIHLSGQRLLPRAHRLERPG